MSDPATSTPAPAVAASPAATPARPGLFKRGLSTGAWTLVEHASSMFFRLLSNLVLAGLLAPDAYGLVSVIWTMLIALTMLSDLGVMRTVVQSQRGNEPDFMNTALTLQIIRGLLQLGLMLLIGGGLMLAAQWAWTTPGTAYDDPRLPPMVMAMGGVALLNGAQSMNVLQAVRRMQRKTLALQSVITQAVSASLTIGLAWWTRSPWALVAGSLMGPLVQRVLERLMLSGPPERLMIDKAAMHELFAQGKWLLPASILGFVALHADRLLLAGLFDTTLFGQFAVAFLLVSALQSLAGAMLGNIVFPGLSEVVRERPAELRRMLTRFHWFFDAVFVTLLAAVATSSSHIVGLLYDSRYQEAGWILGVLCCGLMSMRYELVEQCYLAKGQPRYTMVAQSVRLVVMLAGLYVGKALGGFEGAITGMAVAQWSSAFTAYHFKWRHQLLSWRAEALLLPALATGWLLGQGGNWLLTLLRSVWHRG